MFLRKLLTKFLLLAAISGMLSLSYYFWFKDQGYLGIESLEASWNASVCEDLCQGSQILVSEPRYEPIC
jgi:hypothetical protein